MEVSLLWELESGGTHQQVQKCQGHKPVPEVKHDQSSFIPCIPGINPGKQGSSKLGFSGQQAGEGEG